MELKRYVAVLLKWWWLIVLAPAVAAGFSYFASRQSLPIYQATTTLMVGQSLQNPNPETMQVYTAQQLAQTYVQIVRRQPVMQAVVDALGLPGSWQAVAGQTSATVVAGTQLIEIKVIDTNPKRAQAVANEVARQVIAQSPTPNEKQQEERRLFVEGQLKDYEARIAQGKQDIAELEKSVVNEVSARRIQDVQTQIAAKQSQLNTWQANYASLLTFYRGGTNYLSVIEPATEPGGPIGPNTTLNVMLAALIGAALALGAAVLLEYLDDTVKSPDDIERVTGLSALGVIARIGNVRKATDQLISTRDSSDPINEAYRVLRTNLQFSGLKSPGGSLLITSSSPGEGKTTTAANLAVMLAQTQKRIILVDADLRRPSQHKVFGVSNRVGLTSLVLDETLPLDAVVQPTGVPGLQLMTSGPLPPNPAEVLNSVEMTRIVDRLRQSADLVIFDSPPVLAVADAVILAGKVHASLLVVDAGRTRTDALRRSATALGKVAEARLLGAVVNKISTRRAEGYYYYYYYYSTGNSTPRRWWEFWRSGGRRRTRSSTNKKAEIVN
ncbi:MAG: polysaccharide biosynthesis tyrosine autokinase [Chloroflexi bacterium]|nr:polysaccharide biosynthesis tyrosine autokinase [Chloroflexota bacterium]